MARALQAHKQATADSQTKQQFVQCPLPMMRTVEPGHATGRNNSLPEPENKDKTCKDRTDFRITDRIYQESNQLIMFITIIITKHNNNSQNNKTYISKVQNE